jgi:hypothetical protein
MKLDMLVVFHAQGISVKAWQTIFSVVTLFYISKLLSNNM